MLLSAAAADTLHARAGARRQKRRGHRQRQVGMESMAGLLLVGGRAPMAHGSGGGAGHRRDGAHARD
eukprot:5654907-Prymnesium_polylepis.1